MRVVNLFWDGSTALSWTPDSDETVIGTATLPYVLGVLSPEPNQTYANYQHPGVGNNKVSATDLILFSGTWTTFPLGFQVEKGRKLFLYASGDGVFQLWLADKSAE